MKYSRTGEPHECRSSDSCSFNPHPRSLTDMSEWGYWMLFAPKPNFDTTYARHLLFKSSLHSQYCLAIHR
jgi:hypothetical protein